MSGVDFYNQNSARSFPLKDLDTLRGEYEGTGPTEFLIPDSCLVDFGCVFYSGSEYDPETDYAYLHSVTRSGSTITFSVRATATGAADYPLVFTRDITDTTYKYEFVEGGAGQGDRFCDDNPYWEAYLVTGDVSALSDLLPGDGTLTTAANTDMVFEPALLEKVENTVVNSINLAILSRFTVPDCENVEYPDREVYIVTGECLSGDIEFKEGYNCQITQDDVEGQLTFGSVVGAGVGEVCEDFPWHDGESSMSDSPFYGGGPSCGEVIRSINGIPGPNVNLYGGQGINIAEDDSDPNTIVITANFEGMTYCAD